jgi:hypothetical protein
MKHLRYLLAATALLAAAACSQADGITGPRTPATPRRDGGFMGSDAAVGTGGDAGVNSVGGSGPTLPSAPADSNQVDRGGFMGSDA